MRYVLSLFILVLLIITNLVSCEKSTEPLQKKEFRELMLETDGDTLYVRITGNLDAENILITLHGGPGISCGYMVSLEQLSSEDLTVVVYDQRGTGKSSPPKNGYALEHYIADLEAIRNVFDEKKIHIFGHSWGGFLAMMYATVYPQNIKSLLLMGTLSATPGPWQEGGENFSQRIAELQEQGIIPKPLPDSIADAFPLYLPAYFSDPYFDIPQELKNVQVTNEPFYQTYAELGWYNFTKEVGKIELPVLMIWGEDDIIGIPMVEATLKDLKSAIVDTVILNNCGHFWCESQEKTFNAILNFVDQHE
jgi:proline iminopeptidase